MAWFGKKTNSGEHDVAGDDSPTGQIAAQVIADAEVERLREERAKLIKLCLYALDRARSGGVVERLEEGLAAVGVTALRPEGQRFDPAMHEAGGTVPTSDPALDGVVAETELVGFSDGGTILRAPIVMVYAGRQGDSG